MAVHRELFRFEPGVQKDRDRGRTAEAKVQLSGGKVNERASRASSCRDRPRRCNQCAADDDRIRSCGYRASAPSWHRRMAGL